VIVFDSHCRICVRPPEEHPTPAPSWSSEREGGGDVPVPSGAGVSDGQPAAAAGDTGLGSR
jgi:hypothetical protein